MINTADKIRIPCILMERNLNTCSLVILSKVELFLRVIISIKVGAHDFGHVLQARRRLSSCLR